MRFGNMFEQKVETIVGLYEDLCNNYDVETLHKFRVTLRKMYAYNMVFGKKLKNFEYKECKNILKNVIKPTSLLRDLDLFVIEIEDLPLSLGTKEILLDIFLQKQMREFSYLLTPEYQQKFQEFIVFFRTNECLEREISTSFMYDTLCDVQQHILKKFSQINEKTPAAKLHKLRIEFKKLRYAIEGYNEFVSSETDEVKTLLDLKEIQNLFGAIQDNHTRKDLVVAVENEIDTIEMIELKHYFDSKSESARVHLLALVR